MPESKKSPVTDLICDVAVDLVIVPFLHGLGLLQPEANISQELLPLLHAFGNRRHPRLPWLIGPDRGRIPAVDNAERCLPQRSLIGGVEDELRPGQPA